jgi:hypothetical protein
MKKNYKLGIALAVLGIITGLLAYYILAAQYNPVIESKSVDGRLDEVASVQAVYPLLGWIGAAAGALWGAVLYGFVRKENWAWFWGAVAATFQLLAGFFPAIPAMDSHLPTPTLIVFGLAAILWFGMLLIGGVKKNIIWFTFVAGLAYVLTFIDGVAPIAKFTTSQNDPFWNGFYKMSTIISWWGSAAWAIFIFAVLKKKSWAIPVGIFAASMAIFSGYPLGIHNAFFEVHRFSMFLPAPIMSTGLLIYMLLPGTQKMLQEWNETPEIV